MADISLNGGGVLITRPKAQAVELIDSIQRSGGKPVYFPVIEIRARAREAINNDVAELSTPDIAIFASRNAVAHGLEYADKANIAAIGPATAADIRACNKIVDIEPLDGFDSEHLLQHPSLNDVDGKVVRIIRGNGGRTLLAETLSQRGAAVDYLCVYQRTRPILPKKTMETLEAAWQQRQIDAIVVMSVESLVNLIDLLPGGCAEELDTIPLVTPAVRVIKEIQDRYPTATTVLAAGPQPNDMLDAIANAIKTGVEHTT